MLHEFMFDKSIFKSYDIRGVYPDQLSDEVVKKIGRAFVKYTEAKTVAVGQDMRPSSPKLFGPLIEGITGQGADVIDIGQIPIEGLYFTVGHYGYEGGVMVTASHNPKEYNGFKMVKEKARTVRGEEIRDVYEMLENSRVIRGKEIYEVVKKNVFPRPPKKGKITKQDIWPDYLAHVFSFVDVKKIKPARVVVDTSNGMAGKVIPMLASKLPIEIIPLNFRLDGNTPAHSFNPLEAGATDQICQAVKDKKADFGFIFDGDGDRVFLIDEQGNFVRADMTLLMLAKYFLTKNPGAGIVYTLICSKAVPELIKKWGGQPIRSPVGFVNIKEMMIKNGAIVGGELSGHYSFCDNFYSDSGMIAFLILLQIISQDSRKVSEIVKEFDIYVTSMEINFKIENKEGVIEKVKKKYSDGQQEFFDGLSVEYEDWWFNLRPSNTEPLLRLTVEAKNQQLLDKRIKELTSLIKEQKYIKNGSR